MRDLKIRIQQFQNAKNDEIQARAALIDYQSWLSGLYVKSAVSSVLAPRKAKYPNEPIMQDEKGNQVEEKPDTPKKSEAELRQEERYYELLVRKANANIAEIGKEEGKQDE